MFETKNIFVAIAALSCILRAQGASKYYTDENRPYEFGFTIDGEQHRHEKKDENGLIMGEFGFITADGVYHVTVYATDENGNFKILSMKNIRVKPYPTAPKRQGHSFPLPPSSQAGPVAQAPAQQTPAPAAPVKSCSHCSIPTTTKVPSLLDISQVSGDQQYDPQYPNNPEYPQNLQQPPTPSNQQYPPDQENPPKSEHPTNQEYPENQQYPQNSQYPDNPQNPQNTQYLLNDQYPKNEQYPQYSDNPQNPQYPQNTQYPENAINQPGDFNQVSGQNLHPGERNPKQFDLPEYPQDDTVPTKPTLISAQMHIIDKNTDIYSLGPGEREGLPNGLDKQDMKLLLYTFNYTVGFHGHHEEGYTDGTKVGYYFITGRNGVRTRIDYVADENGFRPKISQEVLDLLSDDVPKQETEKDPKFGLKGYEFKWIYYPVESKR